MSRSGSAPSIRINRALPALWKRPVKILAYLTETFIATFGITRPAPEQARTANLVIGGFVLTLILGVFGVLGFMLYTISTR
jgi:hypothetical protein